MTLVNPLSENTEHLGRLCELFGLGEPAKELSRVSGGFHHRMWCLDAQNGRYAIKQLSSDMDVHGAASSTRINATEVVAQEFADRGIPALASLSHRGQHLQVLEGVGYLVFPWTDRKARAKNQITKYHALTVAGILARMHQSDINVAGLEGGENWPLTVDRVTDLLHLARQRNVRDVDILLERLPDILSVVERQESALLTLSRENTVSHGDLDHKNVLWNDAREPLLIDWESARPINPTYEVLMEALDWSGITAHFDPRPFESFLSAYIKAGGVIATDMLSAAFYAIFADWISWMLYNVGRATGVEDLRQRAIGSEQIDLSLSALLRLEKNASRLQDIALRHAS